MTYQDLLNSLSKMTPEQLQCDVTVEDGQNECYPAKLKICGVEYGVLDEDHPVIFVTNT